MHTRRGTEKIDFAAIKAEHKGHLPGPSVSLPCAEPSGGRHPWEKDYCLPYRLAVEAERLTVLVARYEEPYRVHLPGGSMRPMRTGRSCECGTFPDPGLCRSCPDHPHGHCACAHTTEPESPVANDSVFWLGGDR